MASGDAWPALPYARLAPTAETLRLWSQVVGKVRLVRTPWINHSWQVTLSVSARGLATPLIPNGSTGLTLEFDFIAHELVIRVTDGGERRIALCERSVASFYGEVMEALIALGAPPRSIPSPTSGRIRRLSPKTSARARTTLP